MRFTTILGVHKLVDEFHGLHQISCHASHEFEQIVLMETIAASVILIVVCVSSRTNVTGFVRRHLFHIAVRSIRIRANLWFSVATSMRIQPEGYILEAWWVLGVHLELGPYVDGLIRSDILELVPESLIRGPEVPNVWDLEEHHGQPFQAEAEGPGLVLRAVKAASFEDLWLHDATSQNFHPLTLEHHLELKRWVREWEEVVVPSHGNIIPEQDPRHTLERGLEVLQHFLF
mmetsp:Transcript_23168/g.64658  ORF Transcript_23168/g.64658 Transcript_23168/m.64658 type:complete len:231 (+) Transcript_23168:369-1061(+)